MHALGNVAVFDTESSIPPERMAYALNQKLPDDIVIRQSCQVPDDWHPRYQDHVVKTYEYHICNAPVQNPLKRRYSTHVSFPMDVEAMKKGAAYLIGEHDFVSFCNIKTNVEDTVRTVYALDIMQEGEDILAEKVRTAAGVTAPPNGLVLVEIGYDDSENGGYSEEERR